MPVQCLRLEDWDDIHQIAKRRRWFYRGHASETWKLKTSIERVFDQARISSEKRQGVEIELLREFKRAYHQFGHHIPEAGSEMEWLSLMQHYGAPTRLLDFSYSLYVAAYFALETAEDDAAIFAIDGPWAAMQSISELEKIGKNVKNLSARTTTEQETSVFAAHFSPPFARSAYPVNAFRLNDRLRIQKGVFMIPGDSTVGFAENLESLQGYDSSDHVLKIILPITIREIALERLFYMNVSRTSLFPGLDGYARSLGVYHPVFNHEDWYSVSPTPRG